MVGRRTPRLIESKERTYEITQPNATSPFKTFHAWTSPRDRDFAESRLAKDVRVRLCCVESAGVVVVGKFGRAIRVVKSPSSFRFSLVAQTGTGWFPRFVEGFEVEDIVIPAKQSAYALLEEGISFVDTVYSVAVAGSS